MASLWREILAAHQILSSEPTFYSEVIYNIGENGAHQVKSGAQVEFPVVDPPL